MRVRVRVDAGDELGLPRRIVAVVVAVGVGVAVVMAVAVLSVIMVVVVGVAVLASVRNELRLRVASNRSAIRWERQSTPRRPPVTTKPPVRAQARAAEVSMPECAIPCAERRYLTTALLRRRQSAGADERGPRRRRESSHSRRNPHQRHYTIYLPIASPCFLSDRASRYSAR